MPELAIHHVNGLKLAAWHWPGADPPLIFAHATGYHGRIWDRIVQQLPGRRVVAIEARGHGRSDRPAPPYRWPAFGADLAALAESLGLRDAIGIGHSMGGHAVARAACLRPGTFRALLLIDPTIFPSGYYGQPPPDGSFTLRRRDSWQSSDEMFERFHKRPPFDKWKPEILRDYCEHGLLPGPHGFALACPPAVEASIYEKSNAPESDIHSGLAGIAQPVVVLRAGIQRVPGAFNLSASPTDPELALWLPHARDALLEGQSHFIPMESPERVVEEIRELEAATA